MAKYEFFKVEQLPKALYHRLRAYTQRTGLTDTQVTHVALAQFLDRAGNPQGVQPVQTVQGPTSPTPPLDKFTRHPGDKDSELGPDYVVRQGVTLYIGGPRGAQESPAHRQDHDGTNSEDRMGG